jgi:hypothetical protein
MQKLTLVFAALVGFHAQEHRCGPSPLRNDDRLSRGLDLFQRARSVLSEVGNRNNRGNFGHRYDPQEYA